MPDRPKIVTIVGTNASGKSALGVRLAQRFGGEVISADSRQVYRGLDIGTGKLTADEMAGIPHHLIDIADVGERYSVADFQKQAYALIDAMVADGRLPLIVGGTGLYVRSVVEGYRLLAVPPDRRLRAELEAADDDELWERFARLDAAGARVVSRTNRRRLIRAIEIVESGQSYPTSFANSPRYDVLQLGVTWPTEILRERIDHRLRTRIEAGLVDEVRGLLDRGIPAAELDALGLEYRYVVRLINGEFATEEEFFGSLKRAIYRFSRQQMIWFRRDVQTKWLDTSGDYAAEAEMAVGDFVGHAARPA